MHGAPSVTLQKVADEAIPTIALHRPRDSSSAFFLPPGVRTDGCDLNHAYYAVDPVIDC